MGPPLAVALAAVVAVACGEPETAPPPPPPPRPARPPASIAAARTIATRAAFDLVAFADGAALLWAVPVDEGGGVRGLALDPLGAAVGREVLVARGGIAAGTSLEQGPALVEEVAAAAVGRRVAVAWIVRDGAVSRAQASIGSVGLEGLAPTVDLGPSVPGPIESARRGRIAVWSTPEGRAWVAHRIPPARCVAQQGECARIAWSDAEGGTARGVGPLEIRAPCAPAILGAIQVGDAFYVGLCHADGGRPASSLRVLQPAISLASAPDVLDGCTPIGLAPAQAGVVVVAQCEDGLGAQLVDAYGTPGPTVRAVTAAARCEAGRPVLELVGRGGALRVPLTGPVSRIEALLPERIAPAGARAVWTGEALLVAAVGGREVALRRYQCDLAELRRTDIY